MGLYVCLPKKKPKKVRKFLIEKKEFCNLIEQWDQNQYEKVKKKEKKKPTDKLDPLIKKLQNYTNTKNNNYLVKTV